MNTRRVWKETLSLVRLSVSAATFSTWFSKTFVISVKKLDNKRRLFDIGCPSSFAADELEMKYLSLIQSCLSQKLGGKNEVVFAVRQEVGKTQKLKPHPLFEQTNQAEEKIEQTLVKARIQPGFTFENFAVSSTNQMAWAAAEAVSKNPGKAYNPLFLWGGTGVGKTHLMWAIGHKLLTQNPSLNLTYCMGEEFTTEIVEAIRTKTTGEFKNKYRKLKVLMLDDIQFIAGKNSVQEEFFHTFDVLKRSGGQIILVSDNPPSEIRKLEERLRSRFEAGLIIDIPPPDFELRTAITLIKSKEMGLALPMEAAQTIAASLDSARRIEGFLIRLSTETESGGSLLTVDAVTKLIGKTNGEVAPLRRAVLPQDLINAVSEYFSIRKRRLLGPSRVRVVAEPRQILMYLLRVELRLPLQEVGRLLGDRDHTTIMHGVEKISNNLPTNNQLRNTLLGIKQQLSG